MVEPGGTITLTPAQLAIHKHCQSRSVPDRRLSRAIPLRCTQTARWSKHFRIKADFLFFQPRIKFFRQEAS
jgi:hypothetical protein